MSDSKSDSTDYKDSIAVATVVKEHKKGGKHFTVVRVSGIEAELEGARLIRKTEGINEYGIAGKLNVVSAVRTGPVTLKILILSSTQMAEISKAAPQEQAVVVPGAEPSGRGR